MISIQKPTKEDVENIQQVFYETWLSTYPNKEAGITVDDIEEFYKNRFSEKAIQKRLRGISNLSKDKLFLVAKDGEMVVGVCMLVKKESFNQLEAIYVLPSHQRMGVGVMFWAKAMKFFEKDKNIIVQVATYNKQAINFYKKLGFIDTGERFTEKHFKMPISGSLIPEMRLIIKNNNNK